MQNTARDTLYQPRLRNYARDRRAIRLHFSRLSPHNRRDYRLRIAAGLFAPMLRKFAGQLFRLSNADIIVTVQDAPVEAIQAIVDKLRQLFEGDPLVSPPEPGQRDPFCTWYNLASNYRSFYARCRHMAEQAEAKPRTAAEPERQIDPEILTALTEKLETVDVASLLRAQAICAIKPNAPANPLLTEVYTAMPELRTRIAPRYDLSLEPWLFQYFSSELDRRLLAALPKVSPLPGHGVLSINLSIDALLSEEFLVFDETIRGKTKRSIMLEFQAVDVLSDLATYQVARDLAREKGYYVAIDGVTHMTLRFVNRGRLDADMIKIVWTPNMEAVLRQDKTHELKAIVKSNEPERFVLCRCDDKRAIEVGWSLGITAFQGRYVDELIASKKVLRLSEKAMQEQRLAAG